MKLREIHLSSARAFSKEDGSFLLCLLNVVFIFIRSIRNENVRLETNVLYLFIFRIVEERIDGGIFIV